MSNDMTQYVTTRVAAAQMGVDTSYIRNLLLRGKVKGIKLGYDWLVYLPSMTVRTIIKTP